MKRIMIMCPTETDATSFYRGIGPFTRLQKELPDLSLVKVTELNWSTALFADLAFLQRPFLPNHVKACEILKSSRLPIWLDYDDDLFSVPPDNRTHEIYRQDTTQENIRKMVKMADVVTVSTEALRERFVELNKNVIVIPNAIDDWIFDYRRPRRTPRERLVFWRGSDTHKRDLGTVGSEIIELSRETKEKQELDAWHFHFMGYNPWELTERMRDDRTIVSSALDLMEYMRYIEELTPALFIVPLHDSPFNRAKSNIAWIEGSFAGAAVIAPDLPEFNRPGVIKYKTAEDFKRIMTQAMRGAIDLESANRESWEYIRHRLTLSRVNRLREQIFRQLLARPKGF